MPLSVQSLLCFVYFVLYFVLNTPRPHAAATKTGNHVILATHSDANGNEAGCFSSGCLAKSSKARHATLESFVVGTLSSVIPSATGDLGITTACGCTMPTNVRARARLLA